MNISVIIPAYNEEKSIGKTLGELKDALGRHNLKYETIVIDDGSTDTTFDAASSFSSIRVIRHPKNKGYGAALKTGIKNATGEYIITLDSDGQHNPEYIKELLEYIKE